ncbi:MAG: hypothetical protein IJ019_06495 [Alphaproteobacteria bacterium]|nr:hypothetical protein [Alphaproteobacteria bacterium]
MVKENLAAIDLGTNACRIMVTDCNGNLLYRDSISTKLGAGMYANMRFTDEAVTRGINAFSEYAKILKKYDVKKYRAVATASCRMATNGMEFVKKVKDTTGIKIDVIDGAEEAYLNLKGAVLNADKNAKYALVYDLGGGSTEITLATNEKNPKILHTVSIPWGARNSAEAFDLIDFNEKNMQKLQAQIVPYIQKFILHSELEKYKDSCCLIATSSTPLRLASMINQDEKYERQKSDGAVLSCKDLDRVINEIYKMSLSERENSKYIGKNRAPIIISGCTIFKSIYDSLGFEILTASLKSAQDAIIKGFIKDVQTY